MHNHGINVTCQILIVLAGIGSMSMFIIGMLNQRPGLFTFGLLFIIFLSSAFVCWVSDDEDTIIVKPRPGCILYDRKHRDASQKEFYKHLYFIIDFTKDKIRYYRLSNENMIVEEKLIDFLDNNFHDFIQIGYDKNVKNAKDNCIISRIVDSHEFNYYNDIDLEEINW